MGGCLCPAGPDGRWHVELNMTVAAGAGQSGLLYGAVEDDPQDGDKVVFHTMPAERQRGGARARSARTYHFESRNRIVRQQDGFTQTASRICAVKNLKRGGCDFQWYVRR